MRSSSFNNWDFCQMQYYMTYVLGLPRSSSKKADQGTIVHKVMEVLAQCKKTMQPHGIVLDDPIVDFTYDGEATPGHITKDDLKQALKFIGPNKSYQFDDEHIGMVEWTTEDFMRPIILSYDNIDAINKTRINKYKYKHDAKIPYGTIHYGRDFVEGIFQRAYEYYSGDDWAPVDRKDCMNWTWMALEYKDGMFDPRKRTIWAAEPHFDFIIDKPWANFEWDLPSGEKISGKLGIKGTIDLITKVGEGILEIVDWKTGQRLDWASKEADNKKTYSKLCVDFQLLLYYYAARRLYPDVKQIIVSIMFVRDGGPFTICLDDDTIIEVEYRIRKRFEEISKCRLPAMQDVTQRDFRCTRICDYYKMVAPNGDNMCKFIHDKIGKHGIDKVTNKYTQEGFSVGKYQAPGEKTDVEGSDE